MICERTVTKRHLADFVDFYKMGFFKDIPLKVLEGFDSTEIIRKIYNNESISSFIILHELDENGHDMYTMIDGKKRMATILLYAMNALKDEDECRQRRFFNYVVPVEFVYNNRR